MLAATLLHGSFNAVASLSLVYLAGAGALRLGPVGVAGIGAVPIATTACVVHDRRLRGSRPVRGGRPTEVGGPLSPW